MLQSWGTKCLAEVVASLSSHSLSIRKKPTSRTCRIAQRSKASTNECCIHGSLILSRTEKLKSGKATAANPRTRSSWRRTRPKRSNSSINTAKAQVEVEEIGIETTTGVETEGIQEVTLDQSTRRIDEIHIESRKLLFTILSLLFSNSHRDDHHRDSHRSSRGGDRR